MLPLSLADSDGQPPDKHTGLVQLGPELWLDLDAGLVLRAEKKNFLSIRETKILRVLVQAMRNGRQYLDARALAERIHLDSPDNPEHSIETSITNIRQKLGETAYKARILQSRRGYGYRLFPDLG